MPTNTIGKIRQKTDRGLYENMKTFQRKNVKISEIFQQKMAIEK
jgi:hypothetical protein